MKQQFTEIMKEEDEYDYYVTLTYGKFRSLIPNIFNDNNNEFYDIENNIFKLITFSEGAYKVKYIKCSHSIQDYKLIN